MANRIYDEITALERLEKVTKTASISIKTLRRDIRDLQASYGASLAFGAKPDWNINQEIKNRENRLKELIRLRELANRGLRSPITTPEGGLAYSTEKNPALRADNLQYAQKYREVHKDTNRIIAERQKYYKDEIQNVKLLQKGTFEVGIYAGARKAGMGVDQAIIAAKKSREYLERTGYKGMDPTSVRGGPSGKTEEGLKKFDVFAQVQGSNEKTKELKLTFDETGKMLGKASGLAAELNAKYSMANRPLTEQQQNILKIISELETGGTKADVLRKKLHALNMEFINSERLKQAEKLENIQKLENIKPALKQAIDNTKRAWGAGGGTAYKGPPAAPPVESFGYAGYRTSRGVDDLTRLQSLLMGRRLGAFGESYGIKDMSQVDSLKFIKAGTGKEGEQLYQFKARIKDAEGSFKTVTLKVNEFGQAVGKNVQVLNQSQSSYARWKINEDSRRMAGETNIPHPAGKDVGDEVPPPVTPPQDPEKKLKERFTKAQLERLMQTYTPAFDYAKQFGMGPESLKKAFLQQGGVGNTGFMFQQKDDITGVTRNLSVTMDQFGRVVPEVSRRFRNFTQGVLRDVRELAKWTIAIGMIYGPLNKVQQLMSDMVTNQSKLADATIAVNNAMATQSTIFDTVYESAQKAGEAVGGVIDAFVLAYRATGGAANETERLSIAQKLLSDALTLSKLSGMGQAEAIDTLAAALRQVGTSLSGTGDVLTRGTELLDKWVRVTKVANVDLMTLATGFSVLGETAESAGMGIDTLNATIAVIAESTPYSGREAANSVRYMLGGYQSQTAITELNKYGIAVVDNTGKVREFLDVMQELYEMKKVGIIDKDAFNTIANALGGGPRGAARFQAFIDSFGRIEQIRQASFEASGDAAEAMAMKLDTVQTAITRLQNASLGLAQALGDEGGLLTIFKTLVDFGTILVTVLEKVVSLTGKATPALIALGVASIMIGRSDARSRGLMVQSFGQRVADVVSPTKLKIVPGSFNKYATPEEMASWQKNQNIQQGVSGFVSSRAAGLIGGAALAGTTALFNYSQGNTKQAMGNVVGGLLGTALGALGGPTTALIGSAIGSAIAEAFVNATMDYKSEFSSFFAESYKDAVTKGEPRGGASKTAAEWESDIFAGAGGKFSVWMSLFKDADETTKDIVKQYQDLRDQGFTVKGGPIQQMMADWAVPGTYALEGPKGEPATVRMPTFTESAYLKAMEMTGVGTATGARAFTGKQMAEQGIYSAEYSPLVRRQEAYLKANQTEIEQLTKNKREELMSKMIKGEITTGEFGKQIEWLKGAPETSTRWMAAFGQEFINISDDINTTSEAYAAFVDLLATGSEESIQYLNGYVEQINSIESQLEALKDEGEDIEIKIKVNGKDVTLSGRGNINEYLAGLQTEGGALMSTMFTQQAFNQLKMPNIVGSLTQPTPKSSFDIIYADAIKRQKEYADSIDMTTEQYEKWISEMDDFMVLTEKAGKIQFSTAEGVQERWYQASEEALIKEGAIPDTTKGVGFQTYDFTQAQIRSAEAQAKALSAQWATQFGYQPDIETQIAVAKDGTMQVTTDLQIMQMLLQRLVDINQKQLDGMYNLPEGATFWVPLTAAYYRRQGGVGGGTTTAPMEGSGTGAETETKTPSGATQPAPYYELAARDAKLGVPKGFKTLPADIGGVPHARIDGMSELAEDVAKESTLSQIKDLVANFKLSSEFPGVGPEKVVERRLGIKEGRIEPQNWTEKQIAKEKQREGTLNTIFGPIKNYFGFLNKILPDSPFRLPADNTGGGGRGGTRGVLPQTNINTTPTARVNLNLKSTTTLLVDGRVLASVIKQYLANDLIKTTSSYGTSSKNYIV